MKRRHFLVGSAGAMTPSVAGCSVLASPEFELGAIEPREVSVGQGEELQLSLTLQNTGDASGETELDVLLAGETRGTESVSVDSESETTVETSVDTSDLAPGDHEYGFRTTGGEPEEVTGTVTVLEPASFSFTDVEPVSGNRPRGDRVDLSATVENEGETEGTRDVEVVFDGEVQTTESMTLSPDEDADVSHTVDTEALETGDYDFTFRFEDGSTSGTLTVREPEPDPVVTDEAITDPTFVDLDQGGSTFYVTIENGADEGDIGYALVFFDEGQNRWDDDVEVQAQATDHFQPFEEREVSITNDPGSEDFFAFRLWPGEVRADVRNRGPGDGPVEVVLSNGGDVVETQEVVVEAGETTTVEFFPDLSEDQPRGLSVEARLPD